VLESLFGANFFEIVTKKYTK